MFSEGCWALQAPMCDSSLRAGKRRCSSPPAECAIAPPHVVWRGDLYADRPGQSGISVVDFLATPWRQNSSFYWSMTRHLRSKTHYAKIWVSFILKRRCSCLQTPFMLPEWSWLLVAIISVLSVWYTAWQVAENTHLHMFYNSNTRGHQAADHAVKKSNGLCSEHTSSWEGCSQIRHHFCTVSFPWAWSLGLGFYFVLVLFRSAKSLFSFFFWLERQMLFLNPPSKPMLVATEWCYL